MTSRFMHTRRVLALALCTAALAAAAPVLAQVKERTLRFAIVQPLDSNQGVGAQKFAELMEQKSGGKLTVKVFPNGTLGGETAVVSSLQGGTIDLSMIAPAILVGMAKEQAIWDFPFLFANYREVDQVFDSAVGRKLLDRLPEKGLVGLAYWDHGFRNIVNSRRPINRAEDIQGLKLRVPQSPLYIEAFRALGANPVPMPFTEVYTALETKTVDGVEQPNSAVESARFNEVQKYLTQTKHIYTPALLLMGKKAWDTLSEDERKIVRSAAEESALFQRAASRAIDQKALESLKSKGLSVNEMSHDELMRVRAKVKPVIDKFTASVGEPLVREMEATLEKIRATR